MRCLSTYKLKTVYSQNRKNSESITKELFLEIYNTSKNVNEIITKLGISKSTYKKLLSKFEIITKRKENNTRTNNFSVLNIVDFKLFGMTEVLEDLSVFVSYCNFHFDISFLILCAHSTVTLYIFFSKVTSIIQFL